MIPDAAADDGRTARRADLVTYYDAEAADRAVRAVPSWREDFRARFLERLALANLRGVLEVGCGPGRDGAVFQAAGFAYTGLDLSPGMVEHARAAGLEATVGSATDLPAGTATFDAAWSMSVLMHLDDAEFDAALRELGRVVRPGGVVAVGLWGAPDEVATRWEADRDRHYGPARYFHLRTDAVVRERLESLGVVESWATHPGADGHIRYQLAVVRRQDGSAP